MREPPKADPTENLKNKKGSRYVDANPYIAITGEGEGGFFLKMSRSLSTWRVCQFRYSGACVLL
jgi:hypothetical protein